MKQGHLCGSFIISCNSISHDYISITFYTDCTCRFASQAVYSWESIKFVRPLFVPLTSLGEESLHSRFCVYHVIERRICSTLRQKCLAHKTVLIHIQKILFGFQCYIVIVGDFVSRNMFSMT